MSEEKNTSVIQRLDYTGFSCKTSIEHVNNQV